MIYVTSRVENQERIKKIVKENELEVSSRWLDVSPDNVPNNLWTMVKEDVRSADVLLAFIFKGDKKMAGGLIELGIAFGEGIPIIIYAEQLEGMGLTTFKDAKNVTIYDDLDAAIDAATQVEYLIYTPYNHDLPIRHYLNGIEDEVNRLKKL